MDGHFTELSHFRAFRGQPLIWFQNLFPTVGYGKTTFLFLGEKTGDEGFLVPTLAELDLRQKKVGDESLSHG